MGLPIRGLRVIRIPTGTPIAMAIEIDTKTRNTCSALN
jgi:hypothetical protein